ncbi:uncharacterized protein BX663DRAFT_499570 [Cokeromyces recurvatus]|uniref:uncharacterized protein n=1 Tax=Cokeromyces recurvatus TaxID=90255 RepID=UPI002220468B|nr:uncharacterized protein BX663DRAFT_499570 [Cokeromyces recurvatus]KAI7905395.1 hypothetical protein BX663DRAFT_499570 [Cokeromyces recurvatus]
MHISLIAGPISPNKLKNILSIPILALFFIGLFFISTLKFRIIYTAPSVSACENCSKSSILEQELKPPSPKYVTQPIHPKPTQYPFTIVTASSANHLCSLENFLYSLYQLREEVDISEFPRIIVYNIGMNRTQLPILDQFVQTGLVDELVTFDYFKYPRFWDVAINAGEYAWKTGIVHEVATNKTIMDQSNGLLVWLDAGNVVTAEFIRSIPTLLRDPNQQSTGFWSPRSSKTMAQWTHPGLYKYFDANPLQYAHNPNCNGAALGFDVWNESVMQGLVEPWFHCGLDKNCIAPPGSSRANHRQDQAALTFLAYRMGLQCRMSPQYYNIQIHRDKACRTELMALEVQEKLNHPSSIDLPKWYASNTLQLYYHPEWRYPENQIPEHLAKLLNPPLFS